MSCHRLRQDLLAMALECGNVNVVVGGCEEGRRRGSLLCLHLQQRLQQRKRHFYFPCGLAVHFAVAAANGK